MESTTVTKMTLNVGTVAVTGDFFGMAYDALFFGLAGSLVMLSVAKRASKSSAVGGIGAGMVLAGMGTPILSAFAFHHLPVLSGVDDPLVKHFCAFTLGAAWQLVMSTKWGEVVPVMWNWFKARIGAKH